MNDKYFIDTNIFIYSFDKKDPIKQKIARDIIQKALKDQTGCISFQVIQEFLNVSTRKFDPQLSIKDCSIYLNSVLAPLCEVYPSVELYRNVLELSERWKFSFYDSMIITAALQSDCSILYTEDLQSEQKIQTLIITNPFINSS